MESAVSLASAPDGRKRRVSYFYEEKIGDDRYGGCHLWEPQRILSYHLHRHMEISRPNLAGVSDFIQFHSPDYVHFLASITPEYVGFLTSATSETITDPSLKRFNLDVDWECPVFHGLFDYCRSSYQK